MSTLGRRIHPQPLPPMPPSLVERANRGIADLDGWDWARLTRNTIRIVRRWEDKIRPCAACDREPVYEVMGSENQYCDYCREDYTREYG